MTPLAEGRAGKVGDYLVSEGEGDVLPARKISSFITCASNKEIEVLKSEQHVTPSPAVKEILFLLGGDDGRHR